MTVEQIIESQEKLNIEKKQVIEELLKGRDEIDFRLSKLGYSVNGKAQQCSRCKQFGHTWKFHKKEKE